MTRSKAQTSASSGLALLAFAASLMLIMNVALPDRAWALSVLVEYPADGATEVPVQVGPIGFHFDHNVASRFETNKAHFYLIDDMGEPVSFTVYTDYSNDQPDDPNLQRRLIYLLPSTLEPGRTYTAGVTAGIVANAGVYGDYAITFTTAESDPEGEGAGAGGNDAAETGFGLGGEGESVSISDVGTAGAGGVGSVAGSGSSANSGAGARGGKGVGVGSAENARTASRGSASREAGEDVADAGGADGADGTDDAGGADSAGDAGEDSNSATGAAWQAPSLSADASAEALARDAGVSSDVAPESVPSAATLVADEAAQGASARFPNSVAAGQASGSAGSYVSASRVEVAAPDAGVRDAAQVVAAAPLWALPLTGALIVIAGMIRRKRTWARSMSFPDGVDLSNDAERGGVC